MLAVTVATVLVGSIGLYLAYRVVKAHTSPESGPSPWRWTPMGLLIQAVALGWVLLCVAVGIRSRRRRHQGRGAA